MKKPQKQIWTKLRTHKLALMLGRKAGVTAKEAGKSLNCSASSVRHKRIALIKQGQKLPKFAR